MNNRIHVAVGVIFSPDKKQVLITKRKAHQHLAGLWEFPGGKVEKDENFLSALKRELDEELGIDVILASHLTTISHNYPDRDVLLDVWQIDKWFGEPASREDQELAWVDIDKLSHYDFPEANKHITQTLLLPPVYLISPQTYESHDEFLQTIEQCFKAGLKLFQLRLELKKEPEYSNLIKELSSLAKKYSVNLILNGDPSYLKKYNINGIHLKARQLFEYSERPVDEDFILGASCHNEKELLQAEKLNVNYAFLSPVKKTQSHSDHHPLSWKNFRKIREKVKFPVYALGGMSLSDKKIARSYNAHGIALISGIWNKFSELDSTHFSEF